MLNPLGLSKKLIARAAVVAAVSPLALLVAPPKAEAVLRYDIFEQNGNTVVKASGSFVYGSAGSISSNLCAAAGANGNLSIDTNTVGFSFINLCTGPQLTNLRILDLVPVNFPGSASSTSGNSLAGVSSSGLNTTLVAQQDPGLFFQLALDPGYVSGDPISSTSIFSGGFAANSIIPPTVIPGLIGSFQLDGGGDTVEVYFSPTPPTPSASTVPAPLPLLGASAALAWSRRLRARLARG